MLRDRVSNPGPLTYDSGALPIVLRGPAWYVALGMPVHYSFFKLWSWVDLDLLYVKVQFFHLGF